MKILENGKIINDKTVIILCEQALINAHRLDANIVAPSDMMEQELEKSDNIWIKIIKKKL